MLNPQQIQLLEDFRDLKATITDILPLFKIDRISNPVIIYNKDLIFVLEQYIAQKIPQEAILDWVNSVGFTDLYKRYEDQNESLGSVIYELEELDERLEFLSLEEALFYIDTLTHNKSI